MRQIWIARAGAPEVLEVRQAPDPEPRPDEMRIRVEASGVNFADVMGSMGVYPYMPPLPVVPGYEVAGRVDAVGAGLDAGWMGREVMAATRFGGYSDVVCAPANQVFTRPAGLSAIDAAAIPINYLTAWQLLVVMGGLKKGETVLIHSVGGGAGLAATQIAKHIGARVIGAAPAAKHGELAPLGVDHLIDYRTEDFETRARAITDGRGVHLILDPVGGDSLKKGFRLLAPTGRLGIFGASSLAQGKTRSLVGALSMLANKGVFGVNLKHLWDDPELMRVWAGQVLELWSQGAIKPKIARSFSFAEAAAAHHFLQDRKNIGKVILTP